MNAPKMSHTVVFEKPERAHLIASAGFGSTRPRTVARATPVTPTAAAGIGSRTSPTTTAQNRAKKYQAVGFRPSGTGRRATTRPRGSRAGLSRGPGARGRPGAGTPAGPATRVLETSSERLLQLKADAWRGAAGLMQRNQADPARRQPLQEEDLAAHAGHEVRPVVDAEPRRRDRAADPHDARARAGSTMPCAPRTARAPETPTGTIGTPDFRAVRKPDFLNAPRLPSRERVPFGKNEDRDARREAPVEAERTSRALSVRRRSTGTNPASHMDQPMNGTKKSSRFARKRTSCGMTRRSSRMSIPDSWFDM